MERCLTTWSPLDRCDCVACPECGTPGQECGYCMALELSGLFTPHDCSDYRWMEEESDVAESATPGDENSAESSRNAAERPGWEPYLLATRPHVVCLCGSTRFMDVFHEAGWVETLKGHIVLSVGVSKHLPAAHGGESLGEHVASMLDELHLRKIDLADEVLVLNVGGYIGSSTSNEIRYAEATGKPVRYLEARRPTETDRTAPTMPADTPMLHTKDGGAWPQRPTETQGTS